MAKIDQIPAIRRYIAGALEQGYSLRVALAAYRRGGGRIRTDDFATLWRDERRKAQRVAP